MTSVTAPEWQKQKKRRESIKPEFIDFKRYSRFLNPENSSYDFGLKSLIAEKEYRQNFRHVISRKKQMSMVGICISHGNH